MERVILTGVNHQGGIAAGHEADFAQARAAPLARLLPRSGVEDVGHFVARIVNHAHVGQARLCLPVHCHRQDHPHQARLGCQLERNRPRVLPVLPSGGELGFGPQGRQRAKKEDCEEGSLHNLPCVRLAASRFW